MVTYGWLKVAFGICCLGKTCGGIFCPGKTCMAVCFAWLHDLPNTTEQVQPCNFDDVFSFELSQNIFNRDLCYLGVKTLSIEVNGTSYPESKYINSL